MYAIAIAVCGMTPYTVHRTPTGYQLVGPHGAMSKPYPGDDCRERLEDVSAMLNAAYAEGARSVTFSRPRAGVETR